MVRRGQIADEDRRAVARAAAIIRPFDKRPAPDDGDRAQSIGSARTPKPDPARVPEDPGGGTCRSRTRLSRVREAGIVGLGGAAFPTWRKASSRSWTCWS